MQSVRGIRNVLAISAAALLAVVVGVGCGGDQASSGQEAPDRPQPVATIVGDGLVAGDQQAPGPAPVTTTAPRQPIGRPQRPVPPDTPVTTGAPLQPAGVVTTTSTTPATATAPSS
jgi:hypothetical protein